MSAEEETKGGRHAGCLLRSLGRDLGRNWAPAGERKRGLAQKKRGELGLRWGEWGGLSVAGPRGREIRKGEGGEGIRAKNSGGRVFRFSFVFF